MPWKTKYKPLPREKPLLMDYYANGTLELKEEEMPIKESITTKDVPSCRTTGEDRQEDKEEEADNSTTPQTLHHQWTTFPCQWIYPGAMHQPTGEDEAAKEDGTKEGSKEE